MFNNPAIHPCLKTFVKDSPELLSDYLCIYAENEHLAKLLFFRGFEANPRRTSKINLVANSRKFSYTKNKRLNPINFRKNGSPIPYKKHSLIRASFEPSVWLHSHTKLCLKDIEETTNLNGSSRLKGVQS